MTTSCDVIRDLLPLYHDEVCSNQTKEMVDNHLKTCEECKAFAKKIDDETYDRVLENEKESIIKNYKLRTRRKFAFVQLGLVALALITCFIVNLTTAKRLDWFFIVFASLCVYSSFAIVPLLVKSKRFSWGFLSFTASLILLLLTCAIYTGGDWLLIVCVSVLFGLSVSFLPFVLKQMPLKGFAKNNVGLISMLVDTALLYALIFTALSYNNNLGNLSNALILTTFNTACAWVLFALLRYLKANKLTRAGLAVIFLGALTAVVNDVVVLISEGVFNLTILKANLFEWNELTTNANSYLIILLVCLICGISLLIAGHFYKRKRSGRE